MTTIDLQALKWMEKYRRYCDYLGAAQLYLKDNFFLEKKLSTNHVKARILGHWGTVPGLNFIYANLNYLICKHKCEMMFIAGPGHGAPAVLANLFAEETIYDFYKEFPRDKNGTGKLIHDFSWPHSHFPSHVTPSVPGSILEGGELGYSLSTAFGAALDNPDLIVAVAIGDGEAESGPLAAAWHANKFLNPKTSGAVLPIVHINGYKISNPTIYGTMDNEELKKLFLGYGYEPIIIEEPEVEIKMISALERAYNSIREIQRKARKENKILKPAWPVILLRTPKGWHGIHQFKDTHIEGSFHSHGIPIEDVKTNEDSLKAVETWLKSYKIKELVDEKGRPKKEILQFVPQGKYRMGKNAHAIGGDFYKKLSFPNLSKHEAKFASRGEKTANSMVSAGGFLRDIYKLNKNNFRLVCPDELESNKLHKIFEETLRGYVWPIPANAEYISPDGRVTEMLSEHTLQGMMQGYILTGRHGIFVTYEAFATIISSMVDQYAKFLRQSLKIKWRKPVPGAIYLLSSLGWRQDHNGFSHQNPGFVSNIIHKHSSFSQVYYPPDTNSLIVAFEETMSRPNTISVIVAGKHQMPQWLTLKESRQQAKNGIGTWEWVSGKEATKNPDVVLASAGDYITEEAICAVKLCKELIPELKIRYVNISEVTSISLGDNFKSKKSANTEKGLCQYFTADKPVVISYHGYANDIEQLLWPYASSKRFVIHGYEEKGSTTTPFDLKISNKVSRYHLAINLLEQGAKSNKEVEKKKDKIIKMLNKKIEDHQKYIVENGDDPDEVK
ncbi:MAG: phosphoketolase family protein [Candidatus Gracilibacteria bacterium]|jgi:xylulose-5-phosphate/fructose-6-phosphate phosphoketolase